jgi:aminopeptidase N
MREGATPSSSNLVLRSDYTPPAYWIKTVDLTFDLDPKKTLVINKMTVEPNVDVAAGQSLKLDGEDISVTRVMVNGEPAIFRIEGQHLVLDQLPATPFTLEIRNTCAPEKNTHLSGLYTSNDNFFTQCEAQGFRRITYFLDRPDVMAVYTVTIKADAKKYPVLLSNGNLIEKGERAGGKHYVKWHDPFPKPCYLFALVAGHLACRQQKVRTRSGKDHLLQIYVCPGDLEKTEHAMNSLIASIIWDEARFGLQLDLERFMIVAVSDFNMGAMENKGLNVFNTKFVLATSATATDTDFNNIEAVVGHEYFHNWTGNRVTCRDWFQLSLKEGLTVFRDQEFSQDMSGSASAAAVKRIEDVKQLRQFQFPEDSGPMAHPVRPDSYQAIDNFYTATVYEKGAEVVRMMHTLVGREGFARGMKLYFARFDGQAVTCDDFVQSIADANPDSELTRHLETFKHWYSQSGTPRLTTQWHWDAQAQTLKLDVSQACAPTAGQRHKAPFLIPIALGLVGADGTMLPLQLDGESTIHGTHRVLVLSEAKTSWTFVNITQAAVPSLLRGFSAPVFLQAAYRDVELITLLQHDHDPFNRWEASQRLSMSRLLAAIDSNAHQNTPMMEATALDDAYVQAMRAVLQDPALDAAFKDLLLTLPSETYIAGQLAPIDPLRVHAAREAMKAQLAATLHDDWKAIWHTNQNTGAYSPDPVSTGRRALANHALSMLCLHAVRTDNLAWQGKALQRFKDASNMTDRLGALSALIHSHSALADNALARFHAHFRHDPLVIDKWFALQASAPEKDGQVFQRCCELLKHPDFSLKNPNRARSLLINLCMLNPSAFHRADGAGYRFWIDRLLELDAINPQIAARLARTMDNWKNLSDPYRNAAHSAIEQVAANSNLSPDVKEVLERALG